MGRFLDGFLVGSTLKRGRSMFHRNATYHIMSNNFINYFIPFLWWLNIFLCNIFLEIYVHHCIIGWYGPHIISIKWSQNLVRTDFKNPMTQIVSHYLVRWCDTIWARGSLNFDFLFLCFFFFTFAIVFVFFFRIFTLVFSFMLLLFTLLV